MNLVLYFFSRLFKVDAQKNLAFMELSIGLCREDEEE